MKHIVHGEVNFFKIEEMPEGTKNVNPENGKYIVADSETTGNHHCVESSQGISFFEKNNILYMVNKTPAKIYCVVQDRHDTVIAEPGVWEIERSYEYDYLEEEIRYARD